jgi:hypothetical protein
VTKRVANSSNHSDRKTLKINKAVLAHGVDDSFLKPMYNILPMMVAVVQAKKDVLLV